MKTPLPRPILVWLCVFTLSLLLSLTSFAQPANDGCANATTLVSGPTCTNTAGTLRAASGASTPTAGIAAFCGNAASPDVWYIFTAKSTLPTVTLSSMGSNLDNAPRLQIFNTTSCAVATLNANSNACATGTNVATLSVTPATALTVGANYLVRVFTGGNSVGAGAANTWNFNICIVDPAPANDLCGASTLLTTSTTCVNTAGNMYASTLTATTINTPDCSGGAATYDVWYRFVAQAPNPTITLSSVGASFAGVAGMQLLSNNCGGSFTAYYCGTTSIAADFLTPGTTYFIRVYGTGALPATSTDYGYNICITDPVATPPFNDECANAINVPVGVNTCGNTIPGNMAGATASAVPVAPCGGPVVYDVWYKFTAVSTSSTITLGGANNNFATANRRLQLFSGTCGALTSIACNTTSIPTFATTVGTTYYVRVYSVAGPIPNGNAIFNICVNGGANAPIRFGNSYVNVSKQTTGGVVEPGDVLEIRMTINHTSGTVVNPRYVDNIPTNTVKATGADAPIRVITNEGLVYKSFTPNAGDDAATYIASPAPGQFNIRINLGFGGTNPGIPVNNTATEIASATGSMVAGSDRPRGGGGLLFATAYRVVVTGNIGDTITLNPGQFIYRQSAAGPDITLTATPFKILINDSLSLCANSIGVNIASEFGGTFGSGTTLNRSSDLVFPISNYSFVSEVNAVNGVGDGRYAIVKNISPRSGTVRDARRRNTCNVPAALAEDDEYNCNRRMFNGFWFIDGDHTNTNNAIGNNPPAVNANSGYMLMVNADYVASEVYRQSITNLCPNTYYEFSAWVRNICPTCGIDSTNAQFTGSVTAPASGYPGVYPNLSFSLNDVDYYSTGQIDTVGWLKKGFVFRTGPAQTSAVFSIRNNSQGGGGNDWVLDDIAVATCLPTMSYSPTINPTVCQNNPIIIADTISSYFRNYTTYKWQRSTNGGASWFDITSVTTLPDTNYYVTSYTVPPANTNVSDSGDLYRVVVATTASNLTDPNCNISDGITITLSVNDCGIPLKTDLLSFNGKLVSSNGHLSWTTSKEDGPLTFTIERSNDGNSFSYAGSVNSYNNYSAVTNSYTYIDPVPVTGKVYYRLLITDQSGSKKYSRTIQLNKQNTDNIGLVSVINPFRYSLEFDISAQSDTRIEAELLDMFGRPVRKASYLIKAGTNALSLPNTETLPDGTYIFRVKNNDVLFIRKVMKKSF